MSNYTNQDIIDLANTIYGEMASQDYDHMVMTGSTALNRLQAERPDEFGQNLQDVLQNGYYAVSNPNVPYKQATEQSFPDKLSESKYKQAIAVSSGLLKGTIQPTQGQFYFTKEEATKLKRSRKFNFKALKETGKVGEYTVYSY